MNAWLAGGFRHMWFSSTKNTNEQEVCWLNHQSFSEKNRENPVYHHVHVHLSTISVSFSHHFPIIFPPFPIIFPRIVQPFSHHFPIIFPFSNHFPYENWSNWVPGMTFKDLYSCTSQRQQDGMGCLCHMAIAVAQGRFSFWLVPEKRGWLL